MLETIIHKKETRPFIIGIPILFFVLCVSVYTDTLVVFFAFIAACVVVLLFIKKPVNLIYLQIMYLSLIKIVQSEFRGPSAATYFIDFINIVLIISALSELYYHRKSVKIVAPLLMTLLLFLVTVIGYIQNHQPILLYLWGFRNNFRYYGFFLACIVLLKRENIENIYKILVGLLGANLIVCSFQYFVQKIKMDNLGGLFGTDTGCNGYMNMFLCIVSTIVIVKFICKSQTAAALLFTLSASTYIAVISELKIYFIELIVIILCTVLFTKPSAKSSLLVVCAALILYVGAQMLYLLFPNFLDFFNLSSILASGSHYSTGTDLGRLTACSDITNQFFSGNGYKFLFGLGLGSAETSQYNIFNSIFYTTYGVDLHYTWLSDAFMLIENGWLGLAFYESFFVSVFCCTVAFKRRAKNMQCPERLETFCIITQIVCVLCVLISIYDSALRTESGYFAYFMLAVPFVVYYESDSTPRSKAFKYNEPHNSKNKLVKEEE